jgi:hypothetical protein
MLTDCHSTIWLLESSGETLVSESTDGRFESGLSKISTYCTIIPSGHCTE